jgi:hypothetical protein
VQTVEEQWKDRGFLVGGGCQSAVRECPLLVHLESARCSASSFIFATLKNANHGRGEQQLPVRYHFYHHHQPSNHAWL